mgnify:CR=1 FL=1
MTTITSPAADVLAIHGGTPVLPKPMPFMSTGLTGEDIDAAVTVLKSGMLRAASKCEELEKRIGAVSDAKHAMTCANGTCALQLAYEPLFAQGAEVLVPAWSYIATVSMIVARGCVPVFVDCLEDTFQIDPKDLAAKVSPRTVGIACTHLYGCPVDIDGVQRVAVRHGLKVVYDAAQAILARYNGRGIGAFGDAVTYSFYATKNLATGEGGMITCNDDTLARDIRLLRSHGETEKYLHERVGYNYRMNDIAGALGLSRLNRLDAQTQARVRLARRYDQMLSTLAYAVEGLSAPATTPGAEPVYHLYTVKMDLSKFRCTRDEFCKALLAEGVPTAVHYPRSLPLQPALAKFAKKDTPVADGLASRIFSLPMHHDVTEEQVRAVEAALRKVAVAMRA